MDRVATTSLHLVGADGQERSVPLSRQIDGDTGEWVASIDEKGPFALDAECNYGLFDRGEKPLLLHYFARHVHGSSPPYPPAAHRRDVPLEIVPELSPAGCGVRILWRGEPASGVSIVILDPHDDRTELVTNDQGYAEFAVKTPGRHAMRVTAVDMAEKGTLDAKPYEGTMYIATLTMELGSEAPVESAIGSARGLLARARMARAVWHGFPGFKANVTITADDDRRSGCVTVNNAGKVVLDVEPFAGLDWAQRHLEMLVAHRLSGDDIGTGATFAQPQGQHPLGRKVTIDGDAMGSVYRIRDDVIREVHRIATHGCFTISVLDVVRSHEGKYLPRVYTVNRWDAEGRIRASSTVLHRWQRVASFDLPAEVLEIEALDEGSHARAILLTRHELLPGGPSNSEDRQPMEQ